MRALVITLLAGLLGFAAGSWSRSSGKLASEPEPPTASVPGAADRLQTATPPTSAAGVPADADKSLRERLKELARPRNPLAAAAQAQALIAQLTLEDFRALASQPKDFPFPASSTASEGALFNRAYLDAIVRRWLEVDPEGGAAAMRALDEGLVTMHNGRPARHAIGGEMLAALDRARPKSAAARAEEFASGAIDWRRGPMEVSKVFEELARTDPAKAKALTEKITDGFTRTMAEMAVRQGSVQGLDSVEGARAAKDSLTIANVFAEAAGQGPEKLRAAIEASTWKSINTTALVAEGVIRDPEGAWDSLPGELAGKPDGSLTAGATATARMLARELSPPDRERALATADRLPAAWKPAALQPLVAAWALSEPQAALEWVTQRSERASAAFAAFGPWFAADAEGAVAWVEKSAPPEVRQAMSAQIAGIIENTASQKMTVGRMEFFKRTAPEMCATTAALLQHSPAIAARLVAELPTDERAGAAFQPIFEKWLDRDAAGAAQWLEAQPVGRRRDEAVAAFAAAAAPRDAEGAAQWVPTIADQKLREQAVESVFRALERRDPASAQAWRASILPPP